MKRILLSILILHYALSAISQKIPDEISDKAQRYTIGLKELADGFKNPDMLYAPFMFWFWDEPLTTEKMEGMAEKMIEQGINPGYAHPRRSMNESPGLPEEQWLGKEWFDAFKAVTSIAKENHAYFGYVDEYWWPSLRAHGRVLKENPDLNAFTLETEILKVKSGTKVRIPASFFVAAAKVNEDDEILSNSLRLLPEGRTVWKSPKGSDWRLFIFTKKTIEDVNYMDTRLGDKFIDIAIEPYEQNVGHELGKTILGDFIDTEGSYGTKLVWSDTLDSRFYQKYNRDIRLWMPLMLEKDAEGKYSKARWEWFDLVSDIYVENFKKVVDWHSKRGMYCIANFWEESLPAQVLRVGDHMKMQRAFTMPGQDALHDGVLYVHDFKEAVSVGEFENRRVFSEMLGASQWMRFYPTMLKKAINCITAWGISHTAPHGVFTNRNLYGNPWSPDWYTENPLFEFLHLWSDFTRRASFINSFGQQGAEVLLYSPIESVWALTGSFHFDSKKPAIQHPWSFTVNDSDAQRANMIDRAYAKAMNDMTSARIDYLVTDRHYVKEMAVNDGYFRYKDFSFKTIVLPPMDILEIEVAEKLVSFAIHGGNVYALGELPSASVQKGNSDPIMIGLMDQLKKQETFFQCRTEPDIVFASFHNHWKGWQYEMNTDNYGLMPFIKKQSSGLTSPVEFISGAFDMLQQHRIIDGTHFFWLVNNTETTQTPEIVIPGLQGSVSVWNCESGNQNAVPFQFNQGNMNVSLHFDPLEAYWLVIDPSDRLGFAHLPDPGELIDSYELKGEWTLKYNERHQPEIEPEWVIPSVLTSNSGLRTELVEWLDLPGINERFTGFIEYRKVFHMSDVTEKTLIDLGSVHDMAEIWLNGEHVGKKLWKPYSFDVSEYIKEGENVLDVRIGNRVDNYYTNAVLSGLLGPVMIKKYEIKIIP